MRKLLIVIRYLAAVVLGSFTFSLLSLVPHAFADLPADTFVFFILLCASVMLGVYYVFPLSGGQPKG